MKKRKILLVLVVAIFVFSCNSSEAEQNKITKAAPDNPDVIEVPQASSLKPEIKLTPEATKAVADWSFYNELKAAIENMHSPNLEDLKTNLEIFDELYEAAQEETEDEVSLTPSEVNSNAIRARLLAIETRVHALQNETDLNSPDPERLALKLGEVKNAFQNLNLQLNELYTTSVIDLLEEIKRENN